MFTNARFMSAAANLVWLLAAAAAQGQSFSNPDPITIPSSGRASTYPSTITVSQAQSTTAYVSVTLHGLSHTATGDLNVLLVAPTGQATYLMANTNGDVDAVDETLTFVPDGVATLPNGNAAVDSGVYACSVYWGPTNLPLPAPPGPYGSSLAPFLGGFNPNGTWSLYIWDDTSGNAGTLAAGWSLGINYLPPPVPSGNAFSYQGRLMMDGAPVSGNANVRFTLCNNATVSVANAGVAPAVTRSFTDIEEGLISTTLDFGTTAATAQARWLNIEVESPPGSGFVTLLPRQKLTSAPVAQFALTTGNASSADNAINATYAVNAQRADVATLAETATQATNASYASSAGSANTAVTAANAANATNATNAVNAANAAFASSVASGGFSVGGLIGPGGYAGANQHDPLNRSVKSRVGYALSPPGTFEFAGMQTTVLASPSGAGNTCDLSFHTWDSTAAAREVMRINGIGDVGIGTAVPGARLHVSTGAVGFGWQTVWSNSAVASFRGGIRLSDNGFLELTNSANAINPGLARLASNGVWTAVSDGRLKTDVSPMQNHLATAMKLKPVNFRWKATGAADFGLIAQDVRGVLPTLVVGDEATESLTVNYSQLSVVAIGAIQEQQRELETLRAGAAKRDADNAALIARVERLEAAIKQLQNAK